MRKSRSTVILYSLIGTGVALGFFSHGVLGAKGEENSSVLSRAAMTSCSAGP
jgi:hypothetical protein